MDKTRILGFSLPLLLAAAIPAGSAEPAPPPPAAAPPAAADGKASALFTNTVVARGKGVEVTRALLDDEIIRLKAQLAGRGQTLPPAQLATLDRQVLDQLIQIQLIKAKATAADKAAGKALAEKRFEEAKARVGSEEAFNRQLKLMNSTGEEVLARWTDSLTAENVLKRELKVNITDADAKTFYEDNPAHFEQPEMVRASHILLTTLDPKTGVEMTDEQKAAKRKQMEGLLKRARDGEDFAKLAREFSEDPGSKDKGGEYTFPRGQMVPEFETAAFGLKTNQVSDIVTTRYGYHIIKSEDKKAAEMPAFESVKEQARGKATQAAEKQKIEEFIEKARKQTKASIHPRPAEKKK